MLERALRVAAHELVYGLAHDAQHRVDHVHHAVRDRELSIDRLFIDRSLNDQGEFQIDPSI